MTTLFSRQQRKYVPSGRLYVPCRFSSRKLESWGAMAPTEQTGLVVGSQKHLSNLSRVYCPPEKSIVVSWLAFTWTVFGSVSSCVGSGLPPSTPMT